MANKKKKRKKSNADIMADLFKKKHAEFKKGMPKYMNWKFLNSI